MKRRSFFKMMPACLLALVIPKPKVSLDPLPIPHKGQKWAGPRGDWGSHTGDCFAALAAPTKGAAEAMKRHGMVV